MVNEVQVTAGVIRRDTLVLVCQRGPGSSHAGKWEFPGGKVEAGETLEQSLRRELEEELAIDAEIGLQLWNTEYTYAGGRTLKLTFFDVPRYGGEVTNRIFAQIRWAPVEELASIDFLDADREFVARLAHGLR